MHRHLVLFSYGDIRTVLVHHAQTFSSVPKGDASADGSKLEGVSCKVETEDGSA